jgi:hypothetical protein
MKKIKKFEGFFDFFKKKAGSFSVSLESLKDCLYELTDEDKILNTEDEEIHNMVFTDNDLILKNVEGQLTSNKYFEVKGDIALFKISYDPIEISDKKVGDIIDNCKYNIESFDCEVSYFLAIVYYNSAGGYNGKEWKSFNEMIKNVSDKRIRNITIKIKALGGIE